jgi:DeoR family transcriptional regulator, fructose operon transcriptional repressor
VVVLADHTKVGAETFARFGDLGDVDLLVTDAGLASAETVRLERAGLEVVRA